MVTSSPQTRRKTGSNVGQLSQAVKAAEGGHTSFFIISDCPIWSYSLLTFIIMIKIMAYLTAFADNFLQTTVQQVSTFCSLSNHMFHQTKDDRVSLEIMGKLSVHLTFTAFGLYLDPT